MPPNSEKLWREALSLKWLRIAGLHIMSLCYEEVVHCTHEKKSLINGTFILKNGSVNAIDFCNGLII